MLFVLGTTVTGFSYSVTLDWNSLTWTSGATSQSYDVDSLHSGNDVTVSLANTGSYTTLGTNQSPAINSQYTGGVGSTNKSLLLAVDDSNTSQAVTVTISFSYAVQNVSFTLFDVDSDGSSSTPYGFDDEVRNFVATGTSTSYATLTGSADNTVTGTNGTSTAAARGLGGVTAGATTSNGNVSVSFGASGITQISFVYGNYAPNTQSNPTQQGIGIGTITYSVAPEPAPVVFALMCLLIGSFELIRSCRGRAERILSLA